MQASLATCCELATGLHIVGSGICALFEMRAETVQKWTHEIQSETLVSLHSYAKRSQQLPSTPRGTVEILVSPPWNIQTGKPGQAELGHMAVQSSGRVVFRS